MLGLLALVYLLWSYSMFLGTIRQAKPHDPKLVVVAAAIAGLLFGPLLLMAHFIVCAINPKYRPVNVQFIEMHFDPETGRFSAEDSRYATLWLNEKDRQAPSSGAIHSVV